MRDEFKMLKGFTKQTIYFTLLLLIMVVGTFSIGEIQASGMLFSTNSKQINQQTTTNSHQLSVPTPLVTKNILPVQKNSGDQNIVTSQVTSGNSVLKGSNKQSIVKTLSNQKTQKSQLIVSSSQQTIQTQVIKPNSVASIYISASPSTIDIGKSVSFTANGASGTPPYSYSWSVLPTGCSSSDAKTISCTPTTTGTTTVTVIVVDANVILGTAKYSFTVHSKPTGATISANPTSGNIDAGQTVTFTASLTGGDGASSYSWTSSTALGCSSSTSSTISCTPTSISSVQTYSISVIGTDQSSNTGSSGSVSYTVAPTLFVSPPSPSVQSGKLDAGNSVKFTTAASGGSGTYTYSWSGLPSGCSSSNLVSITCTPTVSGSFSIIASVTDGNSNTQPSNPTSYTIKPALGVSIFANPGSGSIDQGQSTTFTAAGNGGSGSYSSYSWTSVPAGCSTSSSASFSCTPSSANTFTVSVKVTDSNSYTYTNSTSFTVLSNPTVSGLSASVNSGAIDANQSVTFSTTGVSGGSGGYSYSWTGLPAGCSSTNTNSLTCTPTAAGSFTIKITATDSNGGSGSATLTSYAIISDPTVGTPTGSPSSIDLGQSVTFTSAPPANGLPSYTYEWISLPTGCTDSGSYSVVCSPTKSGSFTVTVNVTDANDFTVTSPTFTFKVLTSTAISSFTSNSTDIDLNQAVLYSVSATNGTGYYSYSWNLPKGCTTANDNQITCSPSVTGSFAINVTVTDSNNFAVNSSNLLLTIYSDPSAGAPTSTIASGGIDAGQHVTFTSATPTGGFGSYTYSWNNLPTGCTDSGTNTVSCNPTDGGTFVISVTVTDGNGYSTQSSTLSYLVYSSITAPAPTANVSSVDLGQSVKFIIVATGGTGSYSYVYNGLPLGCTTLNANTISCTPSNAGSYTLSVSVTDTNSVTVTGSSLSFNVYTVPTVSAPTTSTSPISVGDTVVFTTTASGGSGSFSYTWTSSANLKCSGSLTNRITCTPDQAGSYTLKVTVTDSNGISATTTTNITVKPSQTTTSSTTPSSPTSTTSSKKGKSSPGFSAIIGLVGIIMSAGVLTYNRRRKNY